MTDDLLEYLPDVTIRPAPTSYFSEPGDALDGALFQGETLHPDVRDWILNTLYGCWMRYYQYLHHWVHVWIAGSGVSYQWQAAREPGDLDILIGVDYTKFRQANPHLSGLSDSEISAELNATSRAELYPETADAIIKGKRFEVTWYVNNQATDIRSIHPYAAYDVSANRWTVHPQQATSAPHSPELEALARKDTTRATDIVSEYTAALETLRRASINAQRVNAKIWVSEAAHHASALFQEIHAGRKAAFAAQGGGYGDKANYRWQAGKASGIIQALGQIHTGLSNYREDLDLDYYGMQLDPASTLVRRAMLYKSPQ